MRHPIYSFGLVVNIGLGVLTANWFILMCGVSVVLLAMSSRVKREEQMMLGAYGEEYQDYIGRTGRFFPRLRRS
jgi:protein-S-isoprenylcysteine O-methyltransferase Ste14